uniref:Uncharacterized protein n=1 Tax=Cacopsylla melanoneura TaxID=428564 RepID=A0A8D8W1Y5_9HEMI
MQTWTLRTLSTRRLEMPRYHSITLSWLWEKRNGTRRRLTYARETISCMGSSALMTSSPGLAGSRITVRTRVKSSKENSKLDGTLFDRLLLNKSLGTFLIRHEFLPLLCFLVVQT